MQVRPNLYEENSRYYYSRRKCFSSHNIFKHNEMMAFERIPSGSSSQPELRGRFIEDDRISSRASSTRGSKLSIPVRETNASKLRRIFLSTERLQRHEPSTKSSQDKPRWHVSSKVRYKANSGISGIYASSIRRNELNDGSELNLRKSKSNMSDIDFKVIDNPKSDLKLVPHTCHHGNFLEVIFPLLEQKRSTVMKKDNCNNFDLRFVISASDLHDSAEKLKEQSMFTLNNRKEMNGSLTNLHASDKKANMEGTRSNECQGEKFQNWEDNTDYFGPRTNANMHSSLQSRIEFITYGNRHAQENPGDILHNSFCITPCSQENQTGGPTADTKLLQNGVTITSRKFTKHERIETEGKLTTKIPAPIGSVSMKKILPAKTRSAFTLKKSFHSEDSLCSIPLFQEFGTNQSKTSPNEQMGLENKYNNREVKKETNEAANPWEFSNSGDSTVQESEEIEKRGSFDHHNYISKHYSERNCRPNELMPAEISNSLDYQLVCLQELGKQLNTGHRLDIQTSENPPKNISEMCVAKENVPHTESSLNQQPVAKKTVCQDRLRVSVPRPVCSTKVKRPFLKDGVVQSISNPLQEQASPDLEILLFKSILVVAFILIFLYDWSNDFNLFQFCANFLKKKM